MVDLDSPLQDLKGATVPTTMCPFYIQFPQGLAAWHEGPE